MERSSRFALLLCAVLTLSALCGCSTPPPPNAAARSDRDIATIVYERLANDAVVQGHTIAVEAENGVVTLSGLPTEPGQRARAVNIARGTPGVRSVNY